MFGGFDGDGGAERGGLPAHAVGLAVGEVLGGVLRGEQGLSHGLGVALAGPLPVAGLGRGLIGALPVEALGVGANPVDLDGVAADGGLHVRVRVVGVGLLPRAGQVGRLGLGLLLLGLGL